MNTDSKVYETPVEKFAFDLDSSLTLLYSISEI